MRIGAQLQKYYSNFLTKEDSNILFNYIKDNYNLERKLVNTTNGEYMLNRGTTMFLEPELKNSDIIPNIWGKDIEKNEFPPLIMNIKNRIEAITGKKYNICLCNMYDNGKRGIGFHSDQEEYGSVSSIASISLGEEREFVFREKDDKSEKHTMILEDGSLMIMGENCQERYEHSVPTNKKYKHPRINLTFRLFSDDRYSQIY